MEFIIGLIFSAAQVKHNPDKMKNPKILIFMVFPGIKIFYATKKFHSGGIKDVRNKSNLF